MHSIMINGDTVKIIVEEQDPIETIKQLLPMFEDGYMVYTEKKLYFMEFVFLYGKLELDEMAFGCVLRKYENIHTILIPFYKRLSNIASDRYQDIHRNEMVTFGLDLIFNYIISKYQYYEERDDNAYVVLNDFIHALDWDHIGYQYLWLCNPVLIEVYRFDNSEWTNLIENCSEYILSEKKAVAHDLIEQYASDFKIEQKTTTIDLSHEIIEKFAIQYSKSDQTTIAELMEDCFKNNKLELICKCARFENITDENLDAVLMVNSKGITILDYDKVVHDIKSLILIYSKIIDYTINELKIVFDKLIINKKDISDLNGIYKINKMDITGPISITKLVSRKIKITRKIIKFPDNKE